MIHLVLTDDWETRGSGISDIRSIQFNTLRRLRDLYEDYGVKGLLP